MGTTCTLKYNVTGVADADATSTHLVVQEEIRKVLIHPGQVSVSSASSGLEVTISVTDIEPFSQNEFEPYVYEHVLWHSIFACCKMDGEKYEFKLLSSSFE